MVAKKNSKFDNKFKSTTPADSRTANVRIERKVKDDLPKLSLNFKDFDFKQCPSGQTFEQWQKEGMLSVLMQKFVDVCSNNIIEAKEKAFCLAFNRGKICKIQLFDITLPHL